MGLANSSGSESSHSSREDKSALLHQLKIDRAPELSEPSGSRLWLLVAAITAVVLIAGATFWWLQPSGVPIKVATAKGVENGTAARGASKLDASGYIVARRQATVSSKTTGRVVEVLIEEGQRVVQGEVIARLDDSNTRLVLGQAEAQLAQAQANTQAAKTALDNAQPIFERYQRLHAQGVISDLDFDNAKAAFDATDSAYKVAMRTEDVMRAQLASARQNQEDTVIRAPFAGVITVKAAQAGETVSPVSAGGGFTRTGIGTIVDMDSLELEVDVSENFINRVYPQQPAVVRLNAYPDWEIPAAVIAVIPTADQAKATVKVRIGFAEKDPRILPEMGARVSFLEENNNTEKQQPVIAAVVVPNESVIANGDSGVVFVVRDNVVERRAVRLGAKTRDGQLILSGLTVGAKVAVGSLEQLSDQARVDIVDK